LSRLIGIRGFGAEGMNTLMDVGIVLLVVVGECSEPTGLLGRGGIVKTHSMLGSHVSEGSSLVIVIFQDLVKGTKMERKENYFAFLANHARADS